MLNSIVGLIICGILSITVSAVIIICGSLYALAKAKTKDASDLKNPQLLQVEEWK